MRLLIRCREMATDGRDRAGCRRGGGRLLELASPVVARAPFGDAARTSGEWGDVDAERSTRG
jgi:hypothetical protein